MQQALLSETLRNWNQLQNDTPGSECNPHVFLALVCGPRPFSPPHGLLGHPVAEPQSDSALPQSVKPGETGIGRCPIPSGCSTPPSV